MKSMLLPAFPRIALALGLLLAMPATADADELASEWAEGHNSRARLIAGNGIAGIEMQLPEGWKTYWRNPGDAGGVPPSFDWSRSENLAEAKVLYPAPKRFADRAGDTVGYKGTTVFPVEVRAKDPSKPVGLALSLDYGVCKDICIPAEAVLSLSIPPSEAGTASERLAEALKRVPATDAARTPDDPVLTSAHADQGGKRLVIEAEFPAGSDQADLFIEAPAGLYVSLPKKTAENGNAVTFEVDLSDGPDVQELKGAKMTATLVSGKGQSETQFSID